MPSKHLANLNDVCARAMELFPMLRDTFIELIEKNVRRTKEDDGADVIRGDDLFAFGLVMHDLSLWAFTEATGNDKLAMAINKTLSREMFRLHAETENACNQIPHAQVH